MMSWSTPGWLGWIVMTVAMLAFWALIVIGIASLLGGRRFGRSDDDSRRRFGR